MRHLECVQNLVAAGISWDDAWSLRRIAMVLHRWHELECGDSNNYGSWAIVRGRKQDNKAGGTFVHDDDGAPFLEHHHYLHGQGKDTVTHRRLPDREKGAQKRLGKIMARYPGYSAYVQTDPRGAPLFILRPGDIPEDADVSSYYTRGLAVYK